MALQDIQPNDGLPISDRDADAELESGLLKLAPFLSAFARALSGNRDFHEDLVQEAMTKAWRARRAFIRGSNLKAWLCTILRNEFLSQRRRAWRKVDWDATRGEDIQTASDQQQWALELSDVASAMRGLPDAQREALLMVGAGGLSYEEAAKHTSTAIGTIKSRVARGREALGKILDQKTPLPAKGWAITGNAMNEILIQVAGIGMPRR